jgi:hypothetical protein
MRLVDCHATAGKLPRGAIYIGRPMPGLDGSPLANPYIAASCAPKPCTHAVVVPDDAMVERYKRHLTQHVVKGFGELAALRKLQRGSTLACWCVDRDAGLVGSNRPEAETPCHGDVIFTVWTALEQMRWRVEIVSFTADLDRANKAWSDLYQRAFGEPMRWRGSREDCT